MGVGDMAGGVHAAAGVPMKRTSFGDEPPGSGETSKDQMLGEAASAGGRESAPPQPSSSPERRHRCVYEYS